MCCVVVLFLDLYYLIWKCRISSWFFNIFCQYWSMAYMKTDKNSEKVHQVISAANCIQNIWIDTIFETYFAGAEEWCQLSIILLCKAYACIICSIYSHHFGTHFPMCTNILIFQCVPFFPFIMRVKFWASILWMRKFNAKKGKRCCYEGW